MNHELIEKDRKRMTNFMLANVADATTTTFALNVIPQMQEVGPLGSQMVENNAFQEMLLIRFAYVVILLGVYALAKTNHDQLNLKLDFVAEKTIDISNFVIWTIVAWNLLQIALETKII